MKKNQYRVEKHQTPGMYVIQKLVILQCIGRIGVTSGPPELNCFAIIDGTVLKEQNTSWKYSECFHSF